MLLNGKNIKGLMTCVIVWLPPVISAPPYQVLVKYYDICFILLISSLCSLFYTVYEFTNNTLYNYADGLSYIASGYYITWMSYGLILRPTRVWWHAIEKFGSHQWIHWSPIRFEIGNVIICHCQFGLHAYICHNNGVQFDKLGNL